MRVTILLLLSLAAPGVAAQSNDPVVTVREFVRAWSSGDVDAAGRYWTSPASGDFDRQVRRPLRSSCITLHDAHIGAVVTQADGSVEIPVELRYTRQSMMPGAPVQHETAYALLRLRRDDATWRIEQWREAEEQFV